MRVNSATVQLNSTDPEYLRAFYRDTVGLPGWPGFDFALAAGATMLAFDSHDAVTGPAHEPARWMLAISVDNLAAETGRLIAGGVPCIRNQGREVWGGSTSTFVDPDGNYFQLMSGPT